MAPPEDIRKFHDDVVLKIVTSLESGSRVVAHCRGGVGRAGLLACCVCLFRFGDFFKTSTAAIAFVRERRDKRCVESRRQEDFVAAYLNFIKSN